MARLMPVYRRSMVPGQPVAVPMDPRKANLLDIKNAGTLLVYDVGAALRRGASREVSVQIRKAYRDTDVTAMVVAVRHGNFADEPFEDMEPVETFAAAVGIKVVPVACRYLALVTTTAGSASGEQLVEAAVEVGGVGEHEESSR